MERARLFGTPRPESQAIRLHNPPVMKAFNNAWEAFFRQGVTDHAIKELCQLYIAKSVDCQYCGGQRSVLAMQRGTTESQVDDILDFETSERFDDRERTALAWAMAIAWDPALADDDSGAACTSTSPSPSSSSSATSSRSRSASSAS